MDGSPALENMEESAPRSQPACVSGSLHNLTCGENTGGIKVNSEILSPDCGSPSLVPRK